MLVDKDLGEAEKASAFFDDRGREESGGEGGPGDHAILCEDLAEEGFVERLGGHALAGRAGIVIANIGPWYGDLDLRAAEIAARLARSSLVFLGGFRSREEGHEKSLRAVRERLGREGFRTRLVEHAFLPEGYLCEGTAAEARGPFRIEPSWNTVGVVAGRRPVSPLVG